MYLGSFYDLEERLKKLFKILSNFATLFLEIR